MLERILAVLKTVRVLLEQVNGAAFRHWLVRVFHFRLQSGLMLGRASGLALDNCLVIRVTISCKYPREGLTEHSGDLSGYKN